MMRARMHMAASGGMTMVEVLFAMVLMLMVSLALMSTAMVSIESNTRNRVRDEGTRLAERTMREVRQMPYDDMSTYPASTLMNVPINNGRFPFQVDVELTPLVGASQILVRVSWPWKGSGYIYNSTMLTIRKD